MILRRDLLLRLVAAPFFGGASSPVEGGRALRALRGFLGIGDIYNNLELSSHSEDLETVGAGDLAKSFLHRLAVEVWEDKLQGGTLHEPLTALKANKVNSSRWKKARATLMDATGERQLRLMGILSDALRHTMSLGDDEGKPLEYEPFAFLVKPDARPYSTPELLDRMVAGTINAAFEQNDDDTDRDENGALYPREARIFRKLWVEDLERVEALSHMLGLPAPHIQADVEGFVTQGRSAAQLAVRRSDGTTWRLSQSGWAPASLPQGDSAAISSPAPSTQLARPRDDFEEATDEEEALKRLRAENAALKVENQRQLGLNGGITLWFDELPVLPSGGFPPR